MNATPVAPDSGGLNTRAQAARYLAISERFLDEEIRAGNLAAIRIGRSIRIATRELERYISELPSHEPASA
jgi:excisionase family DNA binding protein